MDCWKNKTDEQWREEAIDQCKADAYYAVCPRGMNRADRRTAKGKMLVAQAEAAALRAEVEFLREELLNKG